jgi:3-oxoacyl-[acyl-carrier protein] reductase
MKTNRIVLITGAAGGIGGALVKRFLENEDTVIGTDAKQEALDKFALNLQNPKGLLCVSGDISDPQSCNKIAEFAARKTGSIEVLVNCAGYFPTQSFEDMSFEQWNQTIAINLTGNFLLTQACLPYMKKRGWGRIVNFGSASIYEGVPGQAHYVAAKAGIVGFTRSIAREIGQYGITANIVTPGLTLSETAKKTMDPKLIHSQRAMRSIKRDELPEDLVGPTFFLASPDADFMSGQIVNVDGGKTMH